MEVAAPFPQTMWPSRVAVACFALAIAGYAATLTPSLWRAVWAD
jgi:formate-dependent nitrite reductase membrane component NrfD